MTPDIPPMLALAHKAKQDGLWAVAETLADHVLTLAERLEAAERARDLLIEMSISFLRRTYPAEPHLLETAITGREYFATREEAVARLLDVAGVTEDTNTTETTR